MKFVDEATIRVEAGQGGDGCVSFRREKYVPRGGPDGGDGGDGGSVFLVGREDVNTLADFRVQRRYKAKSGRGGAGKQRTGASGDDLNIFVPTGTVVSDLDTEEILGDLASVGQSLCVAQGGRGGLGNCRFKSSVNRTPRKSIPGEVGEKRHLGLELKLIADVGLVGLPNAGKSTLIRAVSDARPKVADYPFTTLHPSLCVVRIETDRSFVMADIPGLIEGAADGIGLGIRFLRHLQRTRLLVHVVDIAVGKDDSVKAVRTIESELLRYSDTLGKQTRWLALNKMDLMPGDEWESTKQKITNALGWEGPVFSISAATGEGTNLMVQAIINYLEQQTT
ncbi:MAG: GTPase ObgE [Nisaea sp.]|nr:GTPase ObgE [Nisaea sp.]|tara:strand:+ start:475 stop:1485 length:1011 start_codon:yes stop_codon:yes gene_type:complete